MKISSDRSRSSDSSRKQLHPPTFSASFTKSQKTDTFAVSTSSSRNRSVISTTVPASPSRRHYPSGKSTIQLPSQPLRNKSSNSSPTPTQSISTHKGKSNSSSSMNMGSSRIQSSKSFTIDNSATSSSHA